jgi:hypothetical protein
MISARAAEQWDGVSDKIDTTFDEIDFLKMDSSLHAHLSYRNEEKVFSCFRALGLRICPDEVL